jgi:hypothetical protein
LTQLEAVIPGELVYYCHDLPSRFNEIYIIPLSDIHYGNPLHSKHHTQKAIDLIASKQNYYTILNGDLAECVIRTSKGDIASQTAIVQKQYEYIRDIFMPIKNKILGVTQGNHEFRIMDMAQIDICDMWAKEWGCPYGREELLIKVSFGHGNARMVEQPYSFFLHAQHGYGGARTKGAKNVKVERQSHQVHADIYLQSHDHDASIQAGVYLMPHMRTYINKTNGFKMGSVHSIDKKLVKTGAFLKRGGYASRSGYDPVSLDLTYIKLQGNRGEPVVRVEM